MQEEIELKLDVRDNGLAKLTSSTWFKKRADRGRMKTRDLVSVYFDTDALKLRRHGISLRVRHAGEKRLQTIKADGHATAGLFTRKEWEKEIDSDTPDLKAAAGTALESLLTKKVRRSLKPLFETRVRRTVVPLDKSGAQVELTLDEGQIGTPKASTAITGIELELKKGERAALLELAEEIASLIPVTLAVHSKADRGYALIEERRDDPVHAAKIELISNESTQKAFKTIGFSCLKHMASNEGALLRGDSGGVHQMRVGLRRLRAAISIFSDLLQDEETVRIKAELKWLTGQLGPARDLDVFVSDNAKLLDEGSPRKGIDALRAELEQRRKRAFQRAKEAVDSPRYRMLVLRTLTWLEKGDWTRSRGKFGRSLRERQIEPYASEELSWHFKKAVKKLKRLQQLDPQQRHKLRINVKKLRYATEFFGSVFTSRKARKLRASFQDRLESLQDCLGKLNDIVIHAKLATDVIHSDAPPKGRRERRERAFAAGLVSGHEQSSTDPALATAVRCGVKLAKIEPFWKH